MDAEFNHIGFTNDDGDLGDFFLPDGLLDEHAEKDDFFGTDEISGQGLSIVAPIVSYTDSSVSVGGELLLRRDSSEISRLETQCALNETVSCEKESSHSSSNEASPFLPSSLGVDSSMLGVPPSVASLSLELGQLHIVSPVDHLVESSCSRVIGPKKQVQFPTTPPGFASRTAHSSHDCNRMPSQFRPDKIFDHFDGNEGWPTLHLPSLQNQSQTAENSSLCRYDNQKLPVPPHSSGTVETSSTASSTESAYSVDTDSSVENANNSAFLPSTSIDASIVNDHSVCSPKFKGDVCKKKVHKQEAKQAGNYIRQNIMSKSTVPTALSKAIPLTEKRTILSPSPISSLPKKDNRKSKGLLQSRPVNEKTQRSAARQDLKNKSTWSEKTLSRSSQSNIQVKIPKEDTKEKFSPLKHVSSEVSRCKVNSRKKPKDTRGHVDSSQVPSVEERSSTDVTSNEKSRQTKDSSSTQGLNDKACYISKESKILERARSGSRKGSNKPSQSHSNIVHSKNVKKKKGSRTVQKLRHLGAETPKPFSDSRSLTWKKLLRCSSEFSEKIYLLLGSSSSIFPSSLNESGSHLANLLLMLLCKCTRKLSFGTLAFMHQSYIASYKTLREYENVRMCFFIPYFFPSLVNSMYHWFGYCYWLPICLWYTFLFELFSVGETEENNKVLSVFKQKGEASPLTVSFSSNIDSYKESSFMKKMRSSIPMVVIFIMFIAEGIWRTCLVLDLNGSELLLVGYLLATIQRSGIFSPIFMSSWGIEALLLSYLFSTDRSRLIVIFAEHLQLVFSLCCLSLIDHIKVK